MIVVGKKILDEFGKQHPHSRTPLSIWMKIIQSTEYKSFNDLKKTFPSADYVVHKYTIFNISGNKYRLIVEIDYLASVVNVKRIWTHAEYSMKINVNALRKCKI